MENRGPDEKRPQKDDKNSHLTHFLDGLLAVEVSPDHRIGEIRIYENSLNSRRRALDVEWKGLAASQEELEEERRALSAEWKALEVKRRTLRGQALRMLADGVPRPKKIEYLALDGVWPENVEKALNDPDMAEAERDFIDRAKIMLTHGVSRLKIMEYLDVNEEWLDKVEESLDEPV
jgi:hypothetical protein